MACLFYYKEFPRLCEKEKRIRRLFLRKLPNKCKRFIFSMRLSGGIKCGNNVSICLKNGAFVLLIPYPF
jgi:hypothetical protein